MERKRTFSLMIAHCSLIFFAFARCEWGLRFRNRSPIVSVMWFIHTCLWSITVPRTKVTTDVAGLGHEPLKTSQNTNIFLDSVFAVRNSSFGKVMFSQACVKNSVRGGACMAGGCMAGGCMAGGVCVAGDMCGWGGVHAVVRNSKI